MPQFATTLSEERIRTSTAAGYWPDRLITDYLADAARLFPSKPAIIDAHASYSYAELERLSQRAAHGLLHLGLTPGEVISLQLPNWAEWTILHLAATRIGVITNPLVPIFRDRELTFMLNLAQSRLIAVPGRFRNYDHAAMALRLRSAVPSLTHILVAGEDAPAGALSWREFMATAWENDPAAPDLAAYRPQPNDVTELIFTSGTTGDPKGVLHTHNTLVAPQLAVIDVLGLTSESVLHIASTFGHQTGVHSGVRLPIHLGATVVYQDIWNPDALLGLIERHRITISNGGPTFLQDMLRSPSLADRDLSSLKIFRCGGAPIPRVLIREAKEKLPGISVHSAWGQTENAIVTMTRPADPEDKIADTDGYPQPGMEIRVVDAQGRPLPPPAEGRLQCRGAFLFVGYAERPDLTSAAFDGDWFDTGDLAFIDADGFVRITGRSKDIIIRGGENIPVAYVENVLYEDARIQDVAVIGMPDSRLGERACAFVTLRPGAGLSLSDMQAHLQSKGVAKQYWPEDIQIIEQFPRTASGKIQKYELKKNAAGVIQTVNKDR